MAVKYVKYGTIWMAAALSTAVGLWFTRPNPAMVAGKDAAHVMAMADERRQVAYLTGTNTPDDYNLGWWTNNVLSTNYSTTVHFSTAGGNGYSVSPTSVVFTASNWSNAQYVTFTAPGYYSPSYTFSFKRDGANQGSVQARMTGVGETNGVYGGEQAYGTLTAGGTYAHVDQGTSQAFWFVLTAAPATNPSEQTNAVPWDVVDANHRIDVMPRLDDVYSNTLCIARNMAGLDTYADAGSGMKVWWLDGDVADGDTIAGADVNWAVSLTATNAFGRVNYQWESTVSNRFSTPVTTSTRWPAAGINYMRGVSGTNMPIPTAFYAANDKTNQSFCGGANNAWTAWGQGTNVYAVKCEIVTGGVVRALNWQITTANLDQARCVLTNLTRTVAYIPAGMMTCTGSVVRTRTAATNVLHIAGTPDRSGMISVLRGVDIVTVSNNAAWTGTLYDCDYRGFYNGYQVAGYPSDDNNAARWTIKEGRWAGCVLPYPGEYACSSGYVARVRVYAVGGAGTMPWVHYYSSESIVTSGTNYTWDAVTPQPQDYDSYNYGLLTTMSTHAGTARDFTWNADFWDTYGSADFWVKENRLSLVSDTSNPATRPSFTIGSIADQDPEAAGIGYERQGWEEWTAGVLYFTGSQEWYSFVHAVKVYAWVVVVDWAWKEN